MSTPHRLRRKTSLILAKTELPPSRSARPKAPDILTTSELAARLKVVPTTLWRWRQHDAVLARCVLRESRHSTWWSVQRLRQAGYLVD